MSSVNESAAASGAARAPTLDLHEIQATLLRPRPAPYFGTHVLLRVDEPSAGRAFLRRLTPHVDSCADWWSATDPWIAVGISYAGLKALGLSDDSLQTFPETFREGMAARARQLGDVGINDPKNWDQAYGKGEVHIGLSAFSDSEESRRRIVGIAREQLVGFSGVSVLAMHDFGAQPGDRNSLGYKDGIDQPAIEGSGVDPLPGQGQPIKPGEFILGYPGEAGFPLPMPQPDILGRNGTYVGFRKYQSRIGAFNRFLQAHGSNEAERELLAAKLVGRWRSGAPLVLAPHRDDPDLVADPQRSNNFDYGQMDPRGLACPIGAHIRRVNPRDTITNMRRRRLIRTGLPYGPVLPEQSPDDGTDRGMALLFGCADLERQFEFIQREWINAPKFQGLQHDKDPIAGDHDGTYNMTVQHKPIKKTLHGLPRFTTVKGGAYVLLPGLRALRSLATPERRASTGDRAGSTV